MIKPLTWNTTTSINTRGRWGLSSGACSRWSTHSACSPSNRSQWSSSVPRCRTGARLTIWPVIRSICRSTSPYHRLPVMAVTQTRTVPARCSLSTTALSRRTRFEPGTGGLMMANGTQLRRCDDWVYDQTTFVSTIVSKVSMTQMTLSCFFYSACLYYIEVIQSQTSWSKLSPYHAVNPSYLYSQRIYLLTWLMSAPQTGICATYKNCFCTKTTQNR